MSLPLAIDLVVIIVVALYLIDGYRRGFILLAIELLGTLLTFYLAFRWSDWAGSLARQLVNFPEALDKPIGFILLWIILQFIYTLLTSLLYRLIPTTIRGSVINRAFGVIPSAIKGFVVIAIVLTLAVVLPIENQLRPAILSSRLGQPLVTRTQQIQQQFVKTYSQELTETLTFLTTTPITRRIDDSTESLKLYFTTTQVTPDPTSEATMLRLVNQERTKIGLKPLTANEELRSVARAHARDMLARGYFSHYTPEGKDPFDRILAAGIIYETAGENLAFAPTVELAHVGLMNSPKHRDNILYTDFGQVGIGVIDAGIHGRMFVQAFRD